MASRRTKLFIAALLLAALAGGGAWAWHENQKVCCRAPDEPEPPQHRPKLGLMTSLPLYWPLGADLAGIAGGEGEVPWQRRVLKRGHELVPLDTLSPIAGLTPEEPESDPLAGIERLAVIQPRGLSPADNVALDEWVRAGGHLLIALDPLLTGHYDLALGDPRRPTDIALVPPVLARWGVQSTFDPEQPPEVSYATLPGGEIPLVMKGEGRVDETESESNACESDASGAIIRCKSVGKGRVTFLFDATVFEHAELAGENGEALQALIDYAFGDSDP